jgi:uncharacterized protein YndB with AHSA1/START domain
MSIAEFRSLDVRLDVQIGATREVVWKSLTDGIGEWWPANFYVGRSPKRFALEPRVGGRVFEDWGDGEGALFGSVTMFEEGVTLQWAGDMSADYGGPARTVTTFALADGAKAGTTSLSFRDTPYGLLGKQVMEGVEQGWRYLLLNCLQPYLERGEQPDRPASVVAAASAKTVAP